MLILSRPGTATIVIGAGLASFGLLILIFLVKFAFSTMTQYRDGELLRERRYLLLKRELLLYQATLEAAHTGDNH